MRLEAILCSGCRVARRDDVVGVFVGGAVCAWLGPVLGLRRVVLLLRIVFVVVRLLAVEREPLSTLYPRSAQQRNQSRDLPSSRSSNLVAEVVFTAAVVRHYALRVLDVLASVESGSWVSGRVGIGPLCWLGRVSKWLALRRSRQSQKTLAVPKGCNSQGCTASSLPISGG